MDRLTELVLAHRRLVVLAWVLVAVAGGVLAPATVDRLTYEFALPDEPAYAANLAIARASGGGGLVDPLVLVATSEGGGGGDLGAALTAQAQQVAAAVPGTRVVSPADAPELLGDGGETAVALLYPPTVPGPEPYAAALPRVEAAVEQVGAVVPAGAAGPTELVLTGTDVLAESSGGSDRGVLAEVLLGGLGAFVVLLLVFTSLLAGLPLLVAAVSILATFLALFGLSHVTDVIFVVQFLVGLIGLGVAIDYSLLITMRWREERAHGADAEQAVRTAMATAGRSVVFSGITVAVSLAALIAVPLPFLRSIGLGGLLIPLLSVATSVTLVPVVLASAGRWLEWPRRRAVDPTSRAWARVAGAVVRRPLLVAVASTVLLLALAAPVLGLHLGSPGLGTYPASTPAGAAVAQVRASGIPAGAVRPVQVLVPLGSGGSGGSGGSVDAGDVDQLVADLAGVPGVAAAVAPAGEGWSTPAGRLVEVWTRADPATGEGGDVVAAVRAAVERTAPGALVGGTPAEDADFVEAVYGDAPWVVLGIVVVTFALLARALRSVWLPVKALVLNVISIAAAYGITVLVWQDGVGTQALFGVPASGAITTWVPIAVFAFLFGLSMDYEVFILSRIREAHDDGEPTDRAVVTGIARTGRLVTSAALILFLAFVALSTVPSVEVKILATALALGIAVDAVVVRALLAPALVVLLGRANWWFPRPLARLLRVSADGDSDDGDSDDDSVDGARVGGEPLTRP